MVEEKDRIDVSPAQIDEQPILANLLELYAHDFSEFYDVVLGPDGRYGYAQLSLYWTEAGRHPFLVRISGHLAGFALVKRVGNTWDMAEFFVVRKYRRSGAGSAIARQVFLKFPGPWEVRVMRSNAAGYEFWKRAIAGFAGRPIYPVEVDRGGRRWNLFSFESPDPRLK